jgi:hypothetical protein
MRYFLARDLWTILAVVVDTCELREIEETRGGAESLTCNLRSQARGLRSHSKWGSSKIHQLLLCVAPSPLASAIPWSFLNFSTCELSSHWGESTWNCRKGGLVPLGPRAWLLVMALSERQLVIWQSTFSSPLVEPQNTVKTAVRSAGILLYRARNFKIPTLC